MARPMHRYKLFRWNETRKCWEFFTPTDWTNDSATTLARKWEKKMGGRWEARLTDSIGT